MTKLDELRAEIDKIDRTIGAAYAKRLKLVREIGKVKSATATEILQRGREVAVIENAVHAAGEEYRVQVAQLYREIMDHSKEEQFSSSGKGDRFLQDILHMKIQKNYGKIRAAVVCQGVPGAYSHIAAAQLFEEPDVQFFQSWKAVFERVQSGDAEFGVLPIENSTAGSVNEVYDLLTEYGLTVVAAKKVRVSHCLLGVKGAKLCEITEVCSHPQALQQCRKTLDQLGIPSRKEEVNTAVAAKKVAEKGDKSLAAIASQSTAELYGLDILRSEAQDEEVNYTRFIVISKEKLLLERGNKISLIVSIDHTEGALHRLLGIFAAAHKNLIKLESRPIPNKQFEFLFYVDLEANVLEEDTQKLLRQVGAYCNNAIFLGSYYEGGIL